MPTIMPRPISSVPTSWGDPASIPRPQPHISTPAINPFLRCPLPNIVTPSPDSLRQFYLGGNVPQYRFSPPLPINNNESAPSTSTTTTVQTTVVRSFSGGSSSSSGTTGITQLTGDVIAGPASGSTPSTVVKVNGGAVPVSQAYIGTNGSGQLVAAVAPANTPAIAHEWIDAYNATTGAFTQTQPAFTDISGVAAPSQLPTPTTSTLGGVEAIAPIAHEWINQIDTSGVPHLSQPAFSDISGTATWAQLPNPPYLAVTTTYVILLTDYTVECTSGTFTVTLPAGASLNQRFEVTNSGTGVITLSGGGPTINGVSTQTLSQWDTLCVYWNGSAWRIR